MKPFTILTSVFMLMCNGFLSAQGFLNNADSPFIVEEVQVNINSNFLLTGESLYFSIVCNNASTGKKSDLSKVVYVELIGENAKAYLQTKIELNGAMGGGDFFLPSDLPTGNYTLIAYTKWMRNFPKRHFCRKQITIINPYVTQRTDGIEYAPGDADMEGIPNDSVQENKPETLKEDNSLEIATLKTKCGNREKVRLQIKNTDLRSDVSVSINVRLEEPTISGEAPVPASKALAAQTITSAPQSIRFLPDIRGETITGTVVSKNTKQPFANRNVYLSIPGKVFVFQISQTDTSGRFYFTVKSIYFRTDLKLQLEGDNITDYDVRLESEFLDDYADFKPALLKPDISLKLLIEQRNVHSQIENAYYMQKLDSLHNTSTIPFYRTPPKIYYLDDYTRFPTMEDIFREYIGEISVTKKNQEFYLQIINSRNAVRFPGYPLLIVDGIPVLDTKLIMDYNPLLFKRISIVPRRYYLAGVQYDGIISFETYNGNAKGLSLSTFSKPYTPWLPTKTYHSPDYANPEKLARIPDHRIQLYWKPIVNIRAGETHTEEFYTSDVSGNFFIEVKGVTNSGAAVSDDMQIEVGGKL